VLGCVTADGCSLVLKRILLLIRGHPKILRGGNWSLAHNHLDRCQVWQSGESVAASGYRADEMNSGTAT
jgi:hypothetical protein